MQKIAEYIEKIDPGAKIYISNKPGDYTRKSPMASRDQVINAKFRRGGKQLEQTSHRDWVSPGNSNDLIYKIISIVSSELGIQATVPAVIDRYNWFLFHTGYNNWNSDILVARIYNGYDGIEFSYQNIELKPYKNSYLFQPQFKIELKSDYGKFGRKFNVEIPEMSHAYLSQFNKNTKKLQDAILNGIKNSFEYNNSKTHDDMTKVVSKLVHDKLIPNGYNVDISDPNLMDKVLEEYIKYTGSHYLFKNIQLNNMEEIMKTFYLGAYDLERDVNVIQIGFGKNARLFRIGGEKSTRDNDPLKILEKANPLSSAFNSITLSIEIRKMNGNKHFGLYGKMHLSNKKSNFVGSFDPNGTLP